MRHKPGEEAPDAAASPARVGQMGRNLLALGASTAVNRGLTFIALVWLARRLGADGYGTVAFTQATASYFMLLAEFGLSVYGTRELARERDQAAGWAGRIIGARGITALIGMGLLLAFVALVSRSTDEKSLLLLFGLSLPVSVITLEWVFQAIEQMHYIALGRTVQGLVYLLLAVLLVSGPEDILMGPVVFVAALLAFNLTLMGIFIRRWGPPRLATSVREIGNVLQQSVAFGLSAIMIQVYYSIDRVILGFVRTSEEVGWYDAAYRLVLLFTGLAYLIAQAILPGLSALWKQKERSQVQAAIRLVAKAMIYLGMPIATGITLLAEPLIDLIYGPSYAPAAAALRIIIWQVFTVYSNVAFAQALLAFNHQRFYFYSAAMGAVANLGLNLFLIPRFGMLGASVATMVAEVIVVASLYAFAVTKITPVSVMGPLLKAALACASMALVVRMLPPNLWLQIGVGALVYGIILVATMPFTAEERQRLLRGEMV